MRSLSRRKVCKFLFHTGTGFLAMIASGSLLSWQSEKKSFMFTKQLSKESVNILNESGNFLQEVKRLKELALPKNSNLYQPPTADELKISSALASALISQDIKGALDKANALNYEVVRFVDTPSKQVFYGLREKRMYNRPIRGWGSYFINTSYRTDALIEVPHTIFDRFTEEIGAKAFLRAAARGLLIAGAHRNANGFGTADVCKLTNSIFHQVHKAWVLSETKTWQIHGFTISRNPKFPDGTESVLSDGQGNISTEVLNLSQKMNKHGFLTYIYNKFSASDPINKPVNESGAGKIFSPLGAVDNIQGIYCRSLGKPFVHIELDLSIRYKAIYRDRIAIIIANSVEAVK